MPNKIAISSYSFHRFGGGPEGTAAPSVEEMIDRCAALGVDGIEFLSEHLRRDDGTSPERLHALKQHAGLHGITPVSVAASHNPVQTTPDARQEELDKLLRAIDWAYDLGAPFVRALGGRWHTLDSFADLLQNNGEEPPADGFTSDDGYAWAIEALGEGATYAGERGVTLVIENHWGLTGTAAGTARIHDGVNSPWLKYVLDTGNFLHRPDQYAEMDVFLADLGLVHAKTYAGGGLLVEADLDYGRIAGMLRDAGYHGYVSVEFEGKAHPEQGVAEGVAMVRAALGG